MLGISLAITLAQFPFVFPLPFRVFLWMFFSVAPLKKRKRLVTDMRAAASFQVFQGGEKTKNFLTPTAQKPAICFIILNRYRYLASKKAPLPKLWQVFVF